MAQIETVIEGIVLDEAVTVSLTELTQLCGANGRVIELMVVEGMLRPQGGQPEDWRFSGEEVRRARRAVRLQRDLDLNLAGAALALDLLDELDRLRERLHALERQLGETRAPR
ncbi:MerR family transcriptional regulator [Thiocystis minor]|uniref:chaperone modulator CbpM n=1 Tax=Thiocystis minor TaxID=61597 RepID=UPI0019123D2E|nr:chaperone modulator CbpM [Thiocystis minor]MBK5963276.1 MerR family transcriptional regulator [Thiocystis minor]